MINLVKPDNTEIVKMLEWALEKAKKGNIKEIFIAHRVREGEWTYSQDIQGNHLMELWGFLDWYKVRSAMVQDGVLEGNTVPWDDE